MMTEKEIQKAKDEMFPYQENVGRSYEQALAASGFELGAHFVLNRLKSDECSDETSSNVLDMVEPKFHEGDFIVNKDGNAYKVVDVWGVIKKYYHLRRLSDNGFVQASVSVVDRQSRLWNIAEDAKDGDVLVSKNNQPFIYNGKYNTFLVGAYCGMDCVGESFVVAQEECHWTEREGVKPASNKQRELLFQKTKEAGYTCDVEKKELKKIHVIDDGKAEMDYCFTKMMAGEKASPAWSEEDENFMYDTLSNLTELKDRYGEVYGNVGKCIDWLKSLKDRVQPQPKQEWSEKDEEMCQETIDWFEKKCFPYALEEENPARESIKWLKSLKNRLPLVKNC